MFDTSGVCLMDFQFTLLISCSRDFNLSDEVQYRKWHTLDRRKLVQKFDRLVRYILSLSENNFKARENPFQTLQWYNKQVQICIQTADYKLLKITKAGQNIHSPKILLINIMTDRTSHINKLLDLTKYAIWNFTPCQADLLLCSKSTVDRDLYPKRLNRNFPRNILPAGINSHVMYLL